MLEAAKQFEDKILNNEKIQKDLVPYDRPVNKVGPEDWKKQRDCQALIKKIKQEKKARQKEMEEL